jgi:hypothetical protein
MMIELLLALRPGPVRLLFHLSTKESLVQPQLIKGTATLNVAPWIVKLHHGEVGPHALPLAVVELNVVKDVLPHSQDAVVLHVEMWRSTRIVLVMSNAARLLVSTTRTVLGLLVSARMAPRFLVVSAAQDSVNEPLSLSILVLQTAVLILLNEKPAAWDHAQKTVWLALGAVGVIVL